MLTVETTYRWPTVLFRKPSVVFLMKGLEELAGLDFEEIRALLSSTVAAYDLTYEGPYTARTPAELVGEIASRLQSYSGYDLHRFEAQTVADDVVRLVFVAPDSFIGKLAVQRAFQLVMLFGSPQVDNKTTIGRRLIDEYLTKFRYSVTNGSLSYAVTAERLGLPWSRCEGIGRMISVGHGRKKRIYSNHHTPGTSVSASKLTGDKIGASKALLSAGLPVPKNKAVRSKQEAINALSELRLPLVVKPAATDRGTAVSMHMTTSEEVENAFDLAIPHGPVLIEEEEAGLHCRLLVIDGRFVSARQQKPAHVVGDGIHTVDELVAMSNSARDERVSKLGKKFKLDAGSSWAVGKQGFRMDSVPEKGREVFLRFHSNLSDGGTAEIVTEKVHPDNRWMAEQASAVFGLEILGVDFITTDITRSYHEVGGSICEVNSNPGFTQHGETQHLEELFLRTHLKEGDDGRIPTLSVISDGDFEPIHACWRRFAEDRWQSPGICSHLGIEIGGRMLTSKFANEPAGLDAVLSNTQVDGAILLSTISKIAAGGSGVDKAAIAICLPDLPENGPSETDRFEVLKLLGDTHSNLVVSVREPTLDRLAELATAKGPSIWVVSDDESEVFDGCRGHPDLLLAEWNTDRSAIVFSSEGNTTEASAKPFAPFQEWALYLAVAEQCLPRS